MRKLLYVLVGLVVVVVGAAFLVPQFVDLNRYKPRIAEEVKEATGRDLTIAGDISLSILPSLALVVNDVRLANAEGGVAEHMVRVEEAQVEVALLPLLSGSYQVQSVRLVDPEIALEVLPDGRANWTFDPPAEPGQPNGEPAAEPAEQPAPPEDGGDDALPISVENFEIENGTIVYRDIPAGTVERVDDLDATIRLGSLAGPIESSGQLSVRGIDAGFEFALGDTGERTVVPVRLQLNDEDGGFRTQLRGHLSDLRETPRIQGDLSAEGDILAEVIQTVAPQALPGFLAQPFSLQARLDASTSRGALKDLTVKLGETSANGSVSATFDETPSFDVQMAVGRVDLDTWLAMPPVRLPAGAAPGEDRQPDAAAEVEQAAAGAADGAGQGAEEPPAGEPLLPKNLSGDVALSVEAVAYGGKSVHQIQAAAKLAEGELTISQLSALLPGGAEAQLFGFVAAADGQPRFEGQLEARAPDLPGLLAWLGVELEDAPIVPPRSLTAKTALVATPDRIATRDLNVQLDRSTVTGTAVAALGEPMSVEADLRVDRVNLDDLLAPAAGGGAAPATTEGEAGVADDADAGEAAEGVAEDGPAEIVGDLKLAVGTATWRGVPVENVRFDGSLEGDTLTIRNAEVGDLAQASASVQGVVLDPAGDLRLEDVSVSATVPDPQRLARLVDAELPAEVQALGTIKLDGVINGAPLTPTIAATVDTAGSKISADGTANLAAAEGLVYDGTIGIESNDIARLIAALAPDYRPAGPLGATDITANADSAPGRLVLNDLSGTLGGVSMSGALSVDYAGERPAITADLTTGDLVIERFLPAQRASSLPMRVIPTAGRLTPRLEAPRRVYMLPAAISDRWSREPIDLSGLRGLDADVSLRSQSIRYDRYALTDADIAAKLADGTLTVSKLTGRLFDGPVRANAAVDARGAPAFSVELTAENMSVREASGRGSGRATMNATLQGRGNTEAEIVSSLTGNGALSVRGIDVSADPTALPVIGPFLNAVVGPAAILDKTLGGALGGAGQGGQTGVAGATGTFVVADGVLTSSDLAFNTPVYSGTAAGTVDLPQWVMNIQGAIRLSQNLAGTLLQGIKELPQQIPFQVFGPINDPEVDIDLGGITSLTIPGLDRLKEKSPEAGEILEKVVPGLLGGAAGGGTAGDGATEGEAAPPEQGEPAPPKPEKIIEDTLRKLLR